MMSSSKGPHVQDNSVVERRLRPIYDWLDNGNNKKALQECEKVLKKTPNLHCGKALKALTLHRMGKESEAGGLLDGLVEEKPVDDATLQAMTLCYRELQQLDKICKIYETAVKLDANNEELYTHLFMSYARVFDYKSQQKTAMTLYKTKPKTPYYCWAVMSIILQATRGEGRNDGKKRNLLLSLAERMMDKLILDGKLDAEQEVQLYVMILELQRKYDEILVVLDGPLGDKLACSNPPQNRLKYLVPMKEWGEVNLLCKQILIEHVDKWDIWKVYVQSVFELIINNSSATNADEVNNHSDNHNENDNGDDIDSLDDTPEKCHEFICRVVENGADNGYLMRGPYLARFELCSYLVKQNVDPNDVLGETVELFIEYFRKFGHKSCCVPDLRSYLDMLDVEKKSELATRLVKDVGISSTSVPQNAEQMQRHLCALQLSRLCGAHRNLSPDHLRALVTAFSLHYQHGYQNFGQDLLSTDLGPSDPYAVLAAHVLYDLSLTEGDSQPIVVALVLLESLLKNSPSNFHAKLLAVRLYHTVGGALGAQNMYNSLDTKHVQLDSLGYIHCARLPTSGLYSSCSNWFDITWKFFSSNYKDIFQSSDHITFAYKYGSFTKIDEFMDFRERMTNSMHYTTVAVDRIMLSLIECPSLPGLYGLDISSADDKIDWEALRDNHDLNVYVTWDPERIQGPPETRPEILHLFRQNLHFLKLRTCSLWSLASAVDLVRSSDGVRTKHADKLGEDLTLWQTLIEEARDLDAEPLRQDLVTLPLPSRLHVALKTPHWEVIGGCLKTLLGLTTTTQDGSGGEGRLSYGDEIERALGDMEKTLGERMRDSRNDNLTYRRETVEYVVNATEILAMATLVYLLCTDLGNKPGGGGGGGRRNKKKAADPASKNSALDRLNGILRTSLENVVALVESWSVLNVSGDLARMLETLNLNSDGQNVCENISNSFSLACKEIQGVLRGKLKLLSSGGRSSS